MNIILAENAGFCFGVRRALEMAEAATREHDRVYSLGPLIHNPRPFSASPRKASSSARDLEDLPPGSVAMIRAHGAGPATYELAKARNVALLDATCPFVGRVHEKAAQFVRQGYQVLVLGDPNHPEAQGIVAATGARPRSCRAGRPGGAAPGPARRAGQPDHPDLRGALGA